MNEAESRRSATPRFSLGNLLTLVALTAVGTAVGLAYRNHRSMVQHRDQLLTLSSRLQVGNEDELVSSELPTVADDFHSWNVHVPNGQDYELRLGMGAVSENGIPPMVGGARIRAGRHRVTLYANDSASEEFRYVVYVDGKQAIEQAMGSDWIPGGWSSARGMSWPRKPSLSEALQLSARSYEPRIDFGRGNYFNGQSDDYVTRKGYRLWIDQIDRTYQPASPFMGFAYDQQYHGIGLRDGLRYSLFGRAPYEWTFTRPSLNTNDPVLRIAAEFFAGDEKILSSQTQAFQAWQLRNAASGQDALDWQADPAQSEYSAFLHVKLQLVDARLPVVELKWQAGRPDEVGLRLADTPANDRISRWRLRILGGTKHLWREFQIDDRTIDAAKVTNRDATENSDGAVKLDLGNSGKTDVRLRWQTNEPLPLQVLERKQQGYAGMGLYQGLPLTLQMQIPAVLQPTLWVKVGEEDPRTPGTAFPGGTVFEEIQIEFEAVGHDWIWLQAKSRTKDPQASR